jgi:hypothetical protein
MRKSLKSTEDFKKNSIKISRIKRTKNFNEIFVEFKFTANNLTKTRQQENKKMHSKKPDKI